MSKMLKEFRDFAVKGLQEFLELDRPVPGVQRADDLASGQVQRGVQAGGAGTDVVVAGPGRGARQHRQHRGGAIECLDLRLLVHAQHHRPFRRVEIQADDVADLVDEQRIFRQFPRVLAVRLQSERPPDPRYRGLGQAHLGGQ